MSNFPQRKRIRLKNFDYSSNGAYFITICVKDRRELLGKIIVGDDAHIVPAINLSKHGLILQRYIENIDTIYSNVAVNKYVIMPNHVHLILFVNGSMKASTPTSVIVPTIVRSLKTMVTKECGISFWQRSYHDHIIRDEAVYRIKWEYIDTNPARWAEDEYYTT